MLRALDGVEAAYYLVHGLDRADFEAEERHAAREFAAAARDSGLTRLIYLGGIVHDEELSPHLRSRREVGEILRASGVPTVELRASIVIGDGSASYELVKTMVRYLPTVVAPDWLDHLAQPIALDDVVEYLIAALDVPLDGAAVYEIGGAERMRYRDLVNAVARRLDRPERRFTLPTPSLPAVPAELASLLPDDLLVPLHLLESLQHDSDVRDDAASRAFAVEPRSLAEALDAVKP